MDDDDKKTVPESPQDNIDTVNVDIENTVSTDNSDSNADDEKKKKPDVANPKKKIEITDESDDDKLDITDDEEISDIDEDTYLEDLSDNEEETDPSKEADQINEIEQESEAEKDLSDKTVGDAIDATENEADIFKPDPEIDAAVDDIVRTESDETIAETDAKLATLEAQKQKTSFVQKVKNGIYAWWANRPARYGTIAALVVLFTVITLLPTTRYAVLNTLGVRVAASMTVVDSQTRLPLKDINVQIQEQSGRTNEDGEINFSELKLGESNLVISKRGYAENNEQIVLGWGSNPIGEQSLVATGEQFTFVLSDWKSGEVITKAEATAGENSARADDMGKIILTVGEDNIADVEVTISAENYREEIFSGDQLSNKTIDVKLVPLKKHAFISNRNGQYDLYTIDVDGKNEDLLAEATGKEREVPLVTPHPTKNIIAFTSSREGEQNADGFVVDGLFLIDLENDALKRIARSEQLQVIGWSGDKIIFLQVVEGTSAGNDERSKLISYNYLTGERIDLAAANYFNDVELVDNVLYYAVSSFAVPESQAKLFAVDVDGKNTNKLVDSQVWNIFRTGYDVLLFSAVDQKWFQQVGDNSIESVPQQPAPVSKHYIDSPDGKRTIWVEIRDGKGVLLKSNTDDFKEEQVLSMPGLYDALYWVNDSTVVFRVISSDETADYVLNLDGGEMQKIVDVTATRNTFF
jgi:hypothetical protein